MADFSTGEIERLRLLLPKISELLSIADDAAALDVVAGAGQETILDLNEETAATLNLADKTVIDKNDGSATKSLAISELVSFVSDQIGGGGDDFNKQGHFNWVSGGGDGGAGYKLKDIVYHNGNTYVSTVDNNTTEPGAALASWDIFYQNASTSVKGITQLQSTVDDTEENAATPKAINRRDVHDSTKTYKQGARVQNGFGGDWYEAVQDVPANTLITNNAYWLPVRPQNELVKYFTSIPTTNVGVSIFVEEQGQMHWDSTTSSYKKDNFETHNDVLRQTITYCWRYDLQKYHKTISMRATANAAGTINVVFPVAFEDYVSDPKLTDVANAAGATSVGAFAHSSTVTLTGFDAYCSFNSTAAGVFSIFVQGV